MYKNVRDCHNLLGFDLWSSGSEPPHPGFQLKDVTAGPRTYQQETPENLTDGDGSIHREKDKDKESKTESRDRKTSKHPPDLGDFVH